MIYIKDVVLAEKSEKDKRIKTDYKLLHQAAYDLLQAAVKKEYPELESKLTMHRQGHGKPYFVMNEGESVQRAQVQFNISHSFHKVACVIGKGEFGIDIEKIRPWSEKVARRVLHPTEWDYLEKSEKKDEDFIRFWTLKESYGKYCEKGIGMDLKKIFFALNPSAEQGNEIASNQENLLFFQWKIEPDYYLSVCMEKDLQDISTLTNLCFDDKIETC